MCYLQYDNIYKMQMSLSEEQFVLQYLGFSISPGILFPVKAVLWENTAEDYTQC